MLSFVIHIIDILKPDIQKVLLFTILSFICIGSAIQSYTFVKDIPDIPILYDLLKLLAIWPSWVFLAMPVHLLGGLLGLWHLLRYFPSLDSVKMPIVSIIYSYILASWTIYSWDKWFKNSRIKNFLLLLGIGLAIINSPPISILSLSCFIFLSIVFITYIISIYGLVKLLKKFVVLVRS